MNWSRRAFLKNQVNFLGGLGLINLTSCLGEGPLEPYSLYWIHLEGAPLRSLFDLFIDPFQHYSQIKHPTKTKSYKTTFGNYSIPEVWFKNDEPSELLDSLISIRGLSCASPHLKQSRHQWFAGREIQTLFSDREAPYHFSWWCQNEALVKSYQRLLPLELSDNNTNSQGSIEGLLPFLNNQGSKKTLTKQEIKVAILNQFNDDSYFENSSSLNDQTLQEQVKFYRALIRSLESLCTQLKKERRFDKSLIMITSDRARVITSDLQKKPFKTEPMWQGLNLTLISGALKGPITLGNIYQEHPRYAQSYTGTWGVGVENWTPQHVHQLVTDFCLPKGHYGQTKWMSQNPWIDIKPLNHLFIKQGPGQII